MTFRMKISDIFHIGRYTIIAGDLISDNPIIKKTRCSIEIDGRFSGYIEIMGEVHTRKPYRDLWTESRVELTRETIQHHTVWLISNSDKNE